MFISDSFERFQSWRLKHIPHRHFILGLAMLIGLASGLSAIILKNAVYYTRYLLTSGFDPKAENWLYLFYPFIGIVLTVLFVRYFIGENIVHGISRVLHSISRKGGNLEKHDNYSSMIGSTLTVGFGGSVGLEAPIVLTGSALGSSIGKLFRMEPRVMILCVGCGTAGALAAIFKAPIAGVIFALEVLLLDLTMASLLPLLISAITGAVLANFLMGHEVLFNFSLTEPFRLWTIPYFLLLGIFCGFISLYFNRVNYFLEDSFGRIKNTYHRAIIGGLLVSLMIFFFPSLFGEGYDALKVILNGGGSQLLNGSLFYGLQDNIWLFASLILGIMLLKVIAMSITTGSGGVGGVFAPSLFVGGMAGFFFSRVINNLEWVKLSESSFALVGMAGLLAGVMHAPLTAIFLIAEITGGYELLIPLMMVSTISYMTNAFFEPHSVYTKRLAEKGQLPTRNKDKAALSKMNIDDLIEKNFNTIGLNEYLGDLVREVSRSQRNLFPVVDRDGTFHGVIFVNDVRHIIFKQELWGKTLVRELMFTPEITIEVGESLEEVASKFSSSDKYNIAVLDKGKYVGFISRANFFSAYREKLKEFSEE